MTAITFSNAALTSTATRQAPPPRNGENPMKAVAEKLGLSTDDLKKQLDNGKSLNDVAEARGVSHDDLIAAIRAGLPTDQASGTTETDLTELAETIAATTGRPQGPPPGGPKGEMGGLHASRTKLDRISALLETGADEVGSISSAQKLVSMLQDNGVDLNALKSVLDSGDLLDVVA
ncbi:hypothetical protein Aca07nite_55990 [Actinoplanes capillaceus]|uniref:Translation initiation factor IF-2 N-terminal domain-containing protein n=1 Tax=Actinoplanes campanulatus TaxID=113559 RepID=A0ABQ3WPX9_9ACTN|nr:hypothetical protein [Actinoplanes capillaceus]GID48324.1 hypothetical protein Aca07nite_55990 [Actinoplanes capillaceus]